MVYILTRWLPDLRGIQHLRSNTQKSPALLMPCSEISTSTLRLFPPRAVGKPSKESSMTTDEDVSKTNSTQQSNLGHSLGQSCFLEIWRGQN
ncbi:hypothetical protein SRHO_G00004550, partial [Serrasalmus rhombeus]